MTMTWRLLRTSAGNDDSLAPSSGEPPDAPLSIAPDPVVKLWRFLVDSKLKDVPALEKWATWLSDVQKAVAALDLPSGLSWISKADPKFEGSRCLFVRQAGSRSRPADQGGVAGRDRRPGFIIMSASLSSCPSRPHFPTLSGTPGISKSYMANLLVLMAAMLKREVFLEIVQDDMLVHLKPGGSAQVIEKARQNFWPRPVTEEPLYIMDAGGGGPREPLPPKIGARRAFTVVLASPNRKHYNEFAKVPFVEMRLMPTWSETEVEAAWPKLQELLPHLKGIDWRERYDLFGGVLRSLVTNNVEHASRHSTRRTWTSLSRGAVEAMLTAGRRAEDVPNYLFAIVPTKSDYERTTTRSSSRAPGSTSCSALLRRRMLAIISSPREAPGRCYLRARGRLGVPRGFEAPAAALQRKPKPRTSKSGESDGRLLPREKAVLLR